MATTGTISQTTFDTNAVIDEAFRLCGVAAQRITPEMQDIAAKQLYLQLSAVGNRGIPLWAIDKQILPLTQGQQSVTTPVGTIDILNASYRTLSQLTGTSSTRLGGVLVDLGSAQKVTSVGLLATSSGTFNLVFETSDDGVTFTTAATPGTTTLTTGVWTWIDVDGPGSHRYFCIRDQAAAALALTSTYLGGNPYEVPMSRLNKDDYATTPNKTIEGRPLQFWLDRQVGRPVMRLWPAADATTAQIVIWRHRHIMDVGTLQQSIEAPQRWFDAITLRLAYRLCMRIPQVDPGRAALIAPEMQQAETLAWAEERDSSPMRFMADSSAYTR